MRVFTTVFILAVAGSACDSDPAAVQTEPGTEIGIIVSSSDRIATLFPVDSPQSISQLGLAPDGTPVTVAARKRYAVVPLGTFPAVAVIDLSQRSLKATVALPLESGATGVAFINDSVALVANPQRNSITSVNVLRATAGAEIQVGTFPQAIVSVGDTAYVLNSELGADFAPRRTGTVSVV